MGEYDDACTIVCEITEAAGVMLVVIAGNRGTAFSWKTSHLLSPDLLADLLEDFARQLRQTTQTPH